MMPKSDKIEKAKLFDNFLTFDNNVKHGGFEIWKIMRIIP